MTDNLLDGRDVIDSRDIIARIEELEAGGVGRYDETGEADAHEIADADLSAHMDADEREEYAALIAFRDEMTDCLPDWEYGETLVRESYFTTYAQELAEDIGAVSTDASWPNGYIDWERAARDLRMDYTCADLAGVTYWGRS